MTNASHPEYLSTDIRLLPPETTTKFDLYIWNGRNCDDYLLYCPKGEVFTEQHLERLLDLGVTEFYVHSDDEEVFREHLNGNLEGLLRDPSLDPVEKGKIVYEACLFSLETVFKHPKAEFIQKSKETMRHTVDHILTANRDSVKHMIRLITHDPTTYHHSGNVGLLGASLMKEMLGGSDKDLYNIGYGLFLHDIGKSCIDPCILNKPGRLTDAEWEIMKGHPQEGYRLLLEEDNLTAEAEAITLEHHERSDGKGYPQGLKGEQIDPLARICNIVDSYDALMTRRPYKESMTPFQTLKIMKNEMRGQFDKELFERFVHLLD
jgi:HD-GYP domain-containing protein (c-di-GMP phosphodiesterase class II)